MTKTGEAQYKPAVELIRKQGEQRMGVHASWVWYDDPKRLAFSLARYKFVSKMMDGFANVLECGCADGFNSRIVAQVVKKLTAVDFDVEFLESARETYIQNRFPVEFLQHNMMEGPPPGGPYDGIYMLDVLEHIPADQEEQLLLNLSKVLTSHGMIIIGMPSLESQEYASPLSKEGHINCKNQKDFKKILQKYFHTVLMFSMNDEVVHTGFHAMSHYNLAVCCSKKDL